MNTTRHLLVYTISMTIILLGLVACQDSPPAETEATPPTQQVTATDTEIAIMLRHDDEGVDTTDHLVGILGVRSGCVRVDVPDPEDMNALPTSYLAIWPPDYSLGRTPQAILLHDSQGQPVGRVGEFIWIAGTVVDEIPGELQLQLPSDCPGPYLYVTGASPQIPY